MGRIYRKLQKIGGSLVISLPKEWTVNKKLKAGSSIGIEVRNDGTLSIMPTMEPEDEIIEDEIVLEANENVIWELLKKSFAGETKITILSESEISKILRKSIRQYVSRLPNTEIIEETSQKMIVQNFGYKEIPTKKLIQRLLYLVANMFEDLEQKSFDDLDDNFEQLRKFYFILVIHIRTYLRTGIYISSTSEFTPLKAMDYRMFSEKIVELAEILKDLRSIENVLDYYKDIQQYFNEVMNAFLQKDDKLAFKVWMDKDKLFKKADELLNNEDYEDKENVKKLMKIAQKIKDMSALI
ncbi:MAG: AbrB/MazE/SpoVT family DNA-binding domain-containing protein [Candidatus Lokiarchaeota archaeon]|nr:AbrB/MazE/SpoVT family DNA-binding domain-containing protein [Candidatus Lokiarchaeota archaeon]